MLSKRFKSYALFALLVIGNPCAMHAQSTTIRQSVSSLIDRLNPNKKSQSDQAKSKKQKETATNSGNKTFVSPGDLPKSFYVSKEARGNVDETVKKMFWKAVEEKNIDRIKKLLEMGATFYNIERHLISAYEGSNYVKDYYPILKKLIDWKNYELLDMLHASNNQAIRYSQAIHYAAAHSDSQMIDYLVEHGASLAMVGYAKYEYGKNPQWGANPQSNLWILDQKYYNSDSELDGLPIDQAFKYGNSECYNHLKEKYGCQVSAETWATDMNYYIDENNKQIINKYLIPLRENPSFYVDKVGYEYGRHSENYRSPRQILTAACHAGNKELIKELIDLGFSPNPPQVVYLGKKGSYYSTPMIELVQKPDMLDLIKLLISKGAQVNNDMFSEKNARQEYVEWFMFDSGLWKKK